MPNPIRFLPAYRALSAEDERAFRLHTATQIRGTSVIYAALAAGFLLLFNLTNMLGGVPWHAPDNLLRLTGAIAIGMTALLNRNVAPVPWLRNWFFCCVLIAVLMGGVFRVSSLRWDSLDEGGPMIVMLMFGVITAFHLGEKLLLWGILLLEVALLMVFTDVVSPWTLFYLGISTFLMALCQYPYDMLQRQQFLSSQAERIKAETDQLTGAFNRHAFEVRLTELLNNLAEGHTLTLGMLDIDYFKRYNDHYGHLQGDQVLVAVARALKGLPLDLVVRFGGEEFIVVKTHHGAQPDYLRNLHQHIAALALPHSKSPLGQITASIGLASFTRQARGEQPSFNVLSAADEALYIAKESGRNCVCQHNPERDALAPKPA